MPRSLSTSISSTVLVALAVALLGPAGIGAQTAPVAESTPRPDSARTYTFQLVLLVADNEGPAGFENVPPRAQKALTDVRDFLPYKSYHLLDLAWLRSSGRSEAQLEGPANEALSAAIQFSANRTTERIDIHRFVIVRTNPIPMMLEAPRKDGTPTALAPPAVRPLLETSFGMELGETVVVGTAKLDGPSKALVVILSALP